MVPTFPIKNGTDPWPDSARMSSVSLRSFVFLLLLRKRRLVSRKILDINVVSSLDHPVRPKSCIRIRMSCACFSAIIKVAKDLLLGAWIAARTSQFVHVLSTKRAGVGGNKKGADHSRLKRPKTGENKADPPSTHAHFLTGDMATIITRTRNRQRRIGIMGGTLLRGMRST